MERLSREAFQVGRLKREDVEIPELGGLVTLRELTAIERDEYEKGLIEFKGKGRKETTRVNHIGARSKLIVLSAVNEDGSPFFKTSDVDMLNNFSSSVVDKLFNIAASLSGITDEDIEELLGNSETDPSDGASGE